MKFELPLKVFLSYSHRDDPELFVKFRNHLKSLEDDRIVKVWCDRDISVGDNWDNVIHEKLHECQLFLALTSDSFNASAYINGKEMRVAWDRHLAKECRIFPVLWEKWRLPERWRALQFVPSGTKDVIHSENPNESILTVIAELERVAMKMMEGVWDVRDPNTPWPVRAEGVDKSLPYLCDWTKPILQLQDLKGDAPPDRPLLIVLVGGVGDCVDPFLARIHRDELPSILKAGDTAVHDIRTMDWPTENSLVLGNLYLALEAESDSPIDMKVPEGINVVKTMTEGWGSRQAGVLQYVLNELKQPHWSLPANRALLLVLCVSNSDWMSWLTGNDMIRKQIEVTLKGFPSIRSLTIALPRIALMHALLWPRRPEVSRIHGGQYDVVEEQIRSLYGFRKNLRMKPLARELRRILNQCGASA